MERNINLNAAVFDLDGTLCRQDSFKIYLFMKVFGHPRYWIRLFPIMWWMFLTYGLNVKTNNWLKKKTLRLICKNISKEQACADAIKMIHHLTWEQDLLTIIDQCRQHRITTVLATASPQIYVDAITHHFGIDHVISTRMEQDESGTWTGQILGENCYGNEKKHQLTLWCKHHKIDWQHLAFFSDSTADLPSFQDAGLAVAVAPTRSLKRLMTQAGIIPLDAAITSFNELDNTLLHK